MREREQGPIGLMPLEEDSFVQFLSHVVALEAHRFHFCNVMQPEFKKQGHKQFKKCMVVAVDPILCVINVFPEPKHVLCPNPLLHNV